MNIRRADSASPTRSANNWLSSIRFGPSKRGDPRQRRFRCTRCLEHGCHGGMQFDDDRRGGFLECAVGDIQPVAAEHELESRPMREGVVQIGDAPCHEALVRARLRCRHVARCERRHLLEALRREGRQQAADIPEMMGGRPVRNPGTARTFPEGEALQAGFLQQGFRGIQQRLPQCAVVIRNLPLPDRRRAGRLAAALRHPTLDRDDDGSDPLPHVLLDSV